MSRLQEAHERLETAVTRLDQAVDKRFTVVGSQQDATALSDALDAARSDNTRLHTVTSTLASRLDSTIDRLRKILDE
jgi:hypothetical protein